MEPLTLALAAGFCLLTFPVPNTEKTFPFDSLNYVRDEEMSPKEMWKIIQHKLWTETTIGSPVWSFPPQIAAWCTKFTTVPHFLQLYGRFTLHQKLIRRFTLEPSVINPHFFPIVNTKQTKSRGSVVILPNGAGDMIPCKALHTATLFLINNSKQPALIRTPRVPLTSAGQITVVGWESSNCSDRSTTAYFST